MYRAYLDIYRFASSMPEEQAETVIRDTSDQTSMVELSERVGRSYFWTYFGICLFLDLLLLLPIALEELQKVQSAVDVAQEFLMMSIGVAIMASVQGSFNYQTVKSYHKSHGIQVYKYGKVPYDEVYPKALRRRLWLWNLFPFTYLTFVVVPIVTRIQYRIEIMLGTGRVERTHKKTPTDDRDLLDFKMVKGFIERQISGLPGKKEQTLGTLKELFERRISEISADVQRISVILSSLGVGVSLVAFMIKEPIQNLWTNSNLYIAIGIFSVIAVIVAAFVYLISQLQIQMSRRRELSIILDSIDVIVSEHGEPRDLAVGPQ